MQATLFRRYGLWPRVGNARSARCSELRRVAREGLVTSRPGQGTRITSATVEQPDRTPLRRATLANQVERFLLDTMAAGYQADEVEQALRMALDRWHALAQTTAIAPEHVLRFAGSHDPAVSLVAARFGEIAGGADAAPVL